VDTDKSYHGNLLSWAETVRVCVCSVKLMGHGIMVFSYQVPGLQSLPSVHGSSPVVMLQN
jgi:hypothetical protein